MPTTRKPVRKALWLSVKSAKPVRTNRKPKSRLPSRKRQIKPIRRRSKKMVARMLGYRARKEEFLKQHPECSVCWMNKSTQVHHTRGRAGSLLLDVQFWAPVCSGCHRWIHEHPIKARERGWLCEIGLWNKPVGINYPVPP